ncbi:nucleotide exchange factor GrpE [Collimonas sp.]|jgi:molecular chaperone GrpE|uniref:nucleotide exchange factor GrpE n=1 Tax=Collimonas sp. TaxID=1963772 RepID=UPI002CB0ECEE|nr:nucleotide exchange factor GrpE [Collimonas sp.]HWW06797.1 nucleotide exchange factor GrpE [Collimonas sp.]
MQNQENRQQEKTESPSAALDRKSTTPPSQPGVSENHAPAPAPDKDESVSAPAEPGVEEKLAISEAKLAESQDDYLRVRAELDNMRRRVQEEIARTRKYAIEGFAKSLTPVMDSLETALKIETPSVEALKEGVEITLKQLNSAFEQNQLTEINPMPGEKLDPARHQAISMIPSDQNANTIVSVLQKGYMISDRLLRPALVTVAKEKTSSNGA